jgi:ribosomal protein S20
MRGAQKKVLHKNAAARKVSRLSKRVKSMTS